MRRVMLVEDDATMVFLLKMLLEMEDFEVSAYGDGTQEVTLGAMHEVSPDVVLLDINLRNMNGLELLKCMRKDDALKHIKVIMTSGLDSSDVCLQAGANAFLLKPYMPDDLIRKVKEEIN